jgi:cbb3-type cytochrome oxidase maturation protein
MDILYLLIPLSVALVLFILGVFAWAVHGGQFDELEHEGERLFADDAGRLDLHQVTSAMRTEESRRTE